MKQNLIKKMQRIAGLITESDYRASIIENQETMSKYVTVDSDDSPSLDSFKVQEYLESVIDPEYLEDVETFMNDDEGWGESSSYFFDVPDSDPRSVTDEEVEKWAEQEISYYLFSKPDEFPHK